MDNQLKRVNEDTKAAWWQPGLLLATQITGWIVAPILGGLFLGKWLDAKYHTEPWLFLTCIIVAFVITNIGIVREAKRAIQKIEEEGKNKK